MPPKRKAPDDNATPTRATRTRQQPVADTAPDEPDELNLLSTKPLVPPSTPGPRGPPRVVMDCVEIVTPRALAIRSSAACASPSLRLKITSAPSTPSRQFRPVQFPATPSRIRPPLTPRVSPLKLQPRPNDVPVTPSKRPSRPSSPKKGGDLTRLPAPVKLPGVLPAHLVPCLRLQKRAILGAIQSPLSSEDIGDHDHLSTNTTAYTQLHNLLHGTTTRGEGNSCLLLGPRGSGKTSVRLPYHQRLMSNEQWSNSSLSEQSRTCRRNR